MIYVAMPFDSKDFPPNEELTCIAAEYDYFKLLDCQASDYERKTYKGAFRLKEFFSNKRRRPSEFSGPFAPETRPNMQLGHRFDDIAMQVREALRFSRVCRAKSNPLRICVGPTPRQVSVLRSPSWRAVCDI
jgi:hypothetical protein